MNDRLPLGVLWEETAAFVRAELALIVPVALAGFGVPMVTMLLAVPVDQAQAGLIVPGRWMLWFVPAGLAAMFGTLAVSALALRPGATVGECLRVAWARVPSALGLVGLWIAVQFTLAIPVTAMRLVDGGTGPATALANLAVLAVTIWLLVRVIPVWALLVDRGADPVAAVRGVFAATRGRYRWLLLVRMVAALAGVIALVVLLIPISVVFALLGVATGATAVTSILSYVAAGAAFAMVASLWTVYCARLYLRLAGSISGP